MKKYLNKEVCTPLGVLVFLIVYVAEALSNSAPFVDGIPQESFFPLLIFLVGGCASFSLVVGAVKKTAETGKKEKTGGKLSKKIFLVMAVIALFVLLFDILGFMLTAPFLVFAMMLIYDDKPQHIPKKILYSIFVTAAIYILYTFVFEITFPEIWR